MTENCHDDGFTSRTITEYRRAKRLDHDGQQVPFGVPINVVMNVPTEGNKNRIVTKSHPGLIIQAQGLRKGMMKMLSKDSRVKTVLLGKREEALDELKVGSHKNMFLSSDLSAASDRMSHELSFALWYGLFDVLTE